MLVVVVDLNEVHQPMSQLKPMLKVSSSMSKAAQSSLPPRFLEEQFVHQIPIGEIDRAPRPQNDRVTEKMGARILLAPGQYVIALLVDSFRTKGMLNRVVKALGVSPLQDVYHMKIFCLHPLRKERVELFERATDMHVVVSGIPRCLGHVDPTRQAYGQVDRFSGLDPDLPRLDTVLLSLGDL